MSDTVLPNPAFAVDDFRAWLKEDEAKILEALECPDLTAYFTLSVKLAEYQGRTESGNPKREPHPNKLTPEQRARSSAASKLFRWYEVAHRSSTTIELLKRVATLRWKAAGSPTPPPAEAVPA